MVTKLRQFFAACFCVGVLAASVAAPVSAQDKQDVWVQQQARNLEKTLVKKYNADSGQKLNEETTKIAQLPQEYQELYYTMYPEMKGK